MLNIGKFCGLLYTRAHNYMLLQSKHYNNFNKCAQ